MRVLGSVRQSLAMALCAVSVVGAWPAVAGARGPGGRGGQSRERADDSDEARQHKREEVRKRLQVMRTVELAGALDLDEKTALRMGEVFRKHDAEIEELNERRRQNVKALQALIAAQPSDDKALKKAVADLRGVRSKLRTAEEQTLDEVCALLTPLQQAKLVLQLPKHKRRVRHMIKEVRKEVRKEGREGRGDERQGGPRDRRLRRGDDRLDEASPFDDE